MTLVWIWLGELQVGLDPAGVALLPAERTLIVADLHLEKGSSFAVRGQLLPPYDSRVTLARLEALVLRHAPARIVCLGDSFHDGAGPLRLDPADRARLAGLAQRTDWIWIAGNHDPLPPATLPGRAQDSLRCGPLVLRHAAAGLAEGEVEISGHHHPKATVATRGRHVSRRCFVADRQRLVLPAFGAYTGGLDLREPPLADLFRSGARAFLLGRERLYNFGLEGRPEPELV